MLCIHSGYNTEFAVQLGTTTYTTAMKSLVLTPEEKQVSMTSLSWLMAIILKLLGF